MILLGVATACQSIVPASVPPQLSHTPGAPLVITENRIEAEWFSLAYPDGWRVVTNIAEEPLRLILISPDDELLIYVQDASDGCYILESTPDPGFHWRRECLGEAGAELYVWGEVGIEHQAIYDPIFDEVVSSVQFD